MKRGVWMVLTLGLGVAGALGQSRSAQAQIAAGLQQGAVLERASQTDQALALYRFLYRSYPGDAAVYGRFFEFCLSSGRVDLADSLLTVQRRLYPDDDLHDVNRGRIALARGDEAQAMALWTAALDARPTDANLVIRVAGLLIQQRRLDDALALYRSRQPLFPAKPEVFSLHLASLYALRFEFAEATQELMCYLAMHPQQGRLVEGLVLRYNLTGAYLEQIVGVLEASSKTLPEARRILAAVWLEAGEPDQALALETEVLSRVSKKEAQDRWFAFATQALGKGYAKTAQSAFTRLTREFPGFRQAETLRGLAQAAEVQRNFAEALEAYGEIVRSQSKSGLAPEALWRMALIRRDSLDQPRRALALLDSLRRDHPHSTQARAADLETGRCHIRLGDLAGADTSFSRVQKGQAPGTPLWVQGVVEGARTAFYRGRFDTAQEGLDALIHTELNAEGLRDPLLNDGLALRRFIARYRSSQPQALRVWGRAELALRQGNLSLAVAGYDSLTVTPLAGEALWAGAQIAVQQTDWDAAEARIASIIQNHSEFTQLDEALWLAGRVAERRGDQALAMQRYERILVDYPHSLRLEVARSRLLDLEKSR